MNYEIDVLELPKGTKIGDTVNIVDESGEIYFSARILKTEISETGRSVSVTIGDYLIKDNRNITASARLAGSFKDLAANRTLYTWTAYADDEYGSGISLGSFRKIISRNTHEPDCERSGYFQSRTV